MKIGVISDTHGLLRPEAATQLQGCDVIIHGGDIGKPDVMARLSDIAPLHGIRGNVDRDAWALEYPDQLLLTIAGHKVFVIHNRNDLGSERIIELSPDVVICGHSHKPYIEKEGTRLWINPGSAGPRRFRLPVTLALLTLSPSDCDAQIVDLL